MEVVLGCATAVAPTNIAVVKYWGKRDSKLNLPINSSLSVTLDTADLRTVTSACVSRQFTKDRVWLNGKEQDVQGNPRLLAVFQQVRERAQDRVENGKVIVLKQEWKSLNIHVVSENSFPTAAGLASSASGYACLTKALATLMCCQDEELTQVARMGSGSASRSLYGGFVRWTMGHLADGSDSVASQVAPLEHWPEMHALICVVSDHKKTTSSTGGMADSVRTSELLAHRAAHVVPARMAAMEKAIQERNFEDFAELTMKDSNSFHATCLDTYPPIKYMNDTSHLIAQTVHALNQQAGKCIACYTYDAGPNAVIFLPEDQVPAVLSTLVSRFGIQKVDPASANDLFVQGRTQRTFAQSLAKEPLAPVKYIIHTRVGPGASIDDSKALVDLSTGYPKKAT